MPASTKHIMTNVDRMKDDADLLALWNREATDDRTPLQAWSAFVEAADLARIADRIPGSVGRTYAVRYAAEPTPTTSVTKRSTRKAPADRATTATK